ncbi:hypothetical protein TNCV_450501 [Trichonephila clavipes]|nr:hypothetical protein TNCV_450501 [Trichonephila clavipes]
MDTISTQAVQYEEEHNPVEKRTNTLRTVVTTKTARNDPEQRFLSVRKQIVAAAVTQEPMEEEGSDDEMQCDKKDVMPHADGAAALDLALRYLEQQPDTTPADVLFMRRWRNYASSKRLSSLRQKKITELIDCNRSPSVGSLVVRASDSRLEGLGSMLDATKCPPSTHGVGARSGSESLVGGLSRNHGCRGWRIFPYPPVLGLNCRGGDRWCHHLSCRSSTCLRLWQFHSFPSGRTRQQQPVTLLDLNFFEQQV